MTIVEKKPVPVYQSECEECGSVFRYRKSEVWSMHITCPVCGETMWASNVCVGVEESK